jgi:hypothetical protein
MGSRPDIDREKYEEDVIEHVIKGVHASYIREPPRSEALAGRGGLDKTDDRSDLIVNRRNR